MASTAPSTSFVLENFAEELRLLVSNESDRIELLTMIATENEKLASSIVSIIEKHISACRPDCKLWGLYLLDSISKTGNHVYVNHMSRNLFEVFLQVYGSVQDAKTRAKLGKLLRVWMQFGRFDRNLLGQIEYQVNMKRATMGGPRGGATIPGVSQPMGAPPLNRGGRATSFLPRPQSAAMPPQGHQGGGGGSQYAQAPQAQQQQQQQVLDPKLLQALQNPDFMKQLLSKKPQASQGGGNTRSNGKNGAPASLKRPARTPKREDGDKRQKAVFLKKPPSPGQSLLSSEDDQAQAQESDKDALRDTATKKKSKRSRWDAEVAGPQDAAVQFTPSFLGGALKIACHDKLINALYFDQTHQCMQTGIRFRDKKALQRHMDILYQRKKMRTEATLSRKWFVNLEQWQESVRGAAAAQAQDGEEREDGDEGNGAQAEAKKEESFAALLASDPSKLGLTVIADPSISVCPLSREKFRSKYDDADDEFHFEDAVRLRQPYQGLPRGTVVLVHSLPAEVRAALADVSPANQERALENFKKTKGF